MTLEQQLAEAAHNGLRALTLYPTQDGKWQASTSKDRVSWRVETDDDPVVAIRVSLGFKTVPESGADIFG